MFARRLGLHVGGKRRRAHVSEPVGHGIEYIAVLVGSTASLLRDGLRHRVFSVSASSASLRFANGRTNRTEMC